MRRLVPASLLAAVLAAALAVGATRATRKPAPAPATPPAPAAPPVVQLGETRPIETMLGLSSLPTAADEWVEMIRGADHQLDLEHFYLSNKPGEALDPVLDERGRRRFAAAEARMAGRCLGCIPHHRPGEKHHSAWSGRA